MRFGVLGSLSVADGDAAITVTAGKQRVVLAALLLHANRVVPIADLADAIWDEQPPPGAHAAVRNYILRLRQLLGPAAASRIITRDPGYLIELHDTELDLLRFDQLRRQGATAARTGDWQRAFDLLTDALALWRGTPLLDVPSQTLQRDEVPPLAQARLQAFESRFEAALNLGLHAEIVAELESLTARNPLREKLAAQLMLALYRSGRQADALTAYTRARKALTDELGIEPGPELRTLHGQILRADPSLIRAEATSSDPVRAAAVSPAMPTAQLVIPRQLPAGPAHFTGRAAELTELTELLNYQAAGTAQGTTHVIAVIGGTPGIGKTALAVHWAHRAADHFTDGQLYVNLRGFDPAGPPMPPATAIRGFLDALGVPPQRIPAAEDDQVRLYRSLLAGRRMLIVLDNARDEQQVRSLIPGSPGCRVAVTSRNNLPGLVAAHGARQLTLDVLTEDESRQLLVRRLQSEGLAADPGVLSEVIERCARLPLALAIAAARATTGRRLSLGELVDELRHSPSQLDALDLADPAMTVRGVFDWSFRALTPDAARLFRMIAVNPGPDLSVDAAASLIQLRPSKAQLLLRELTRACLLTEPVPGRFTCHDLLRAYAAERCATEESEVDRRAARQRLLDHYLHSAMAAALWLEPNRRPIDVGQPAAGAVSTTFAADADALSWFDAERAVLLAVLTTEDRDFDGYRWKLSWTMFGYFSHRGRWAEWYAAQRIVVAATERSGDRLGLGVAMRLLGQAAMSLGNKAEAREHLERAITVFDGAGDPLLLAATYHDCAHVCDALGSHADGLDHLQHALEVFRSIGEQVGVASALNAIGWTSLMLGRPEQALASCMEALELHREKGCSYGEALVLDSIGWAHHLLGHHAEAIRFLRQAVELKATLNDRGQYVTSLDHLGDAHQAAGNRVQAEECWRRALVIMRELEHPGIEAMRAKLA